ncbi:GreA/GreB family elongation factor [Chloroflexota bacterium]
MNSTVALQDPETQEEETCTLVFPKDADEARCLFSILAPIRTAMLAYEVDDTFECPVPDGKRRLLVEQIRYQPRLAVDYHPKSGPLSVKSVSPREGSRGQAPCA